MTFLDVIKQRVEARIVDIHVASNVPCNALDFCEAFKPSGRPAIIAEIKFASPSRGRIYHGTLDATAIAGEYLAQGASALSILTEPEYFQGNIELIRSVREAFPEAPILLKDFILSEAQIDQGLACGANAVLLMVALLTKQRLQSLHAYALQRGLTPLVEVHSQEELDIALALNPRMIGINHRNLKTLRMDRDLSASLIRQIPETVCCIAESGIERRSQLDRLRSLGFDGFLIGSQFMQHAHPGVALQHLMQGAEDES